jgi:hypothetical protein
MLDESNASLKFTTLPNEEDHGICPIRSTTWDRLMHLFALQGNPVKCH